MVVYIVGSSYYGPPQEEHKNIKLHLTRIK